MSGLQSAAQTETDRGASIVIPKSSRIEPMESNLRRRRNSGITWQVVFYIATTISVLLLIVLLLNIMNGAFGFVIVQDEIPPKDLAVDGVMPQELSEQQLISILENNLSTGLIRRFNFEMPLEERSQSELYQLVLERVINQEVVEAFSLAESLLRQDEIRRELAEVEDGRLLFRSWLNWRFISTPQASNPARAGIRTAIFGSIWMIVLTVAIAFPIGVAAAVYLEEYAKDNRLNRLIQVNIYNLSGVPSIIYGLLGLTVFVRYMEPFTSGVMFGFRDAATANGRTIISAGATLALLILPIIIINSQEAIKAVPNSLRESSYGLGATKWQTIWHHVIPTSFDRILTGTILAISRAVGETAPLVVVGASTFITFDPTSIFSKFTTLPIQIYQWSARPQSQFRNAAAAAIIVLLILLLTMNATAIVLRNRISKKRRLGL
ncbi:MAG: phosphate ABC transporter permease PstA [Spirochaetaceae bacterium]